ncbi:MAG: hypothetical protein NXI20_26515, partial [bacterium]|nr:hypothetical protein [bacterium]
MKDLIAALLLVFSLSVSAQDTTYYSSGNIRSVGELVEGLKEGLWKFYFPSGKVMAEEYYENDLLN